MTSTILDIFVSYPIDVSFYFLLCLIKFKIRIWHTRDLQYTAQWYRVVQNPQKIEKFFFSFFRRFRRFPNENFFQKFFRAKPSRGVLPHCNILVSLCTDCNAEFAKDFSVDKSAIMIFDFKLR